MAGLLLGAALGLPAAATPSTVALSREAAPPVPATAASDAQVLLHWVLATNDHRGRPFAVVDKKAARIVMHGGDGRVLGSTPVLLGLAPGDHAIPGIGDKPLSAIRPDERTTPAGRFETEPGRNLEGEALVWLDYDAGFAIHRLRPSSGREKRAQRLASATPADNRISLGCVVVDVDFYLQVLQPSLGRQRGVVYVLPETRTLASVFGAQVLAAGAGAAPPP